jgi:hypothetical protein
MRVRWFITIDATRCTIDVRRMGGRRHAQAALSDETVKTEAVTAATTDEIDLFIWNPLEAPQARERRVPFFGEPKLARGLPRMGDPTHDGSKGSASL